MSINKLIFNFIFLLIISIKNFYSLEKIDYNEYYNILKMKGEYEKKKEVVKKLSTCELDSEVINNIIIILTYYYDSEDFRENDQISFYDDVIAEGLIKIISKTRKPQIFPILLRFVLYNKRHRDKTINEAWNAIRNIDWSSK